MESLKNDLDKQFPIWEKEFQEMKRKKFQRDLNDLQTKRVYKWHHGFERRPPRSRSHSISSTSSMASSSTSHDARNERHKRKGTYNTGYTGAQKKPTCGESSQLQEARA